jgi:hypothetical protein
VSSSSIARAQELSSKAERTSPSKTATKPSDGTPEANYANFVSQKGTMSLADCVLLRREGNYAKKNYFSKKVGSQHIVWHIHQYHAIYTHE